MPPVPVTMATIDVFGAQGGGSAVDWAAICSACRNHLIPLPVRAQRERAIRAKQSQNRS